MASSGGRVVMFFDDIMATFIINIEILRKKYCYLIYSTKSCVGALTHFHIL